MMDDADEVARAKAFVSRLAERALAMEGTCTGEHGVGYGKKKYLVDELGAAAVDLLGAIKMAVDPRNLMNPGKIVWLDERQNRGDFAAVWEARRDPDARPGTEQRTFAIITCPPNDLVAAIHDRMPVMLHEKDYARWLSDDSNPVDIMVPFPSELMKIWPVSTRVNNVRNQEADLIDPVDLDEPDLLQTRRDPGGVCHRGRLPALELRELSN